MENVTISIDNSNNNDMTLWSYAMHNYDDVRFIKKQRQ